MSDAAPKDDTLDPDDLILLLNAHDIWLQLPPSVLLERYFESNARANSRVRYTHGVAAKDWGARQSIIVSAQKGCFAPRDTISNLHCNDVPESTLPEDIYGFLTDNSRMKWGYI